MRPIAVVLTTTLALTAPTYLPASGATPGHASTGSTALGQAEPPYHGTISLDPDIVTSEDRSAFTALRYAGRGEREVFDRRENRFVTINAYLFDLAFDDGLSATAVLNPEFGSEAEARRHAETYARAAGQLPHVLRIDVDELWIHRGTELFGGGNRALLIHTGQADEYVDMGILEETLVHEATHTSLDGALYESGSGWYAAQSEDDAYISVYARDNPLREDVAETYLAWLAVRHRADRIDDQMADTIRATVPARLRLLDDRPMDLHPVVARDATGVTITSGPTQRTAQSEVAFEFTHHDPSATFECRMGDTTYRACTSPHRYSQLDDSTYRFEVRVEGAEGAAATPAVWTFQVTAQACATATAEKRAAKKQVRKARKHLQRAKQADRKRAVKKARRKLRQARTERREAVAQAQQVC